MSRLTLTAAAAGIVLALLAIGAVLPRWLLFLVTMAASHGVVSLGILLIMRGGLVSFGQGLFFALGAYAAALAVNRLGVSDAVLLIAVGGAAAGLVGAATGPLLARYSGIFFGMLTLALSMVLYGVLVKASALGGSDGFNIPRPTLLGRRLDGAAGALTVMALGHVEPTFAYWTQSGEFVFVAILAGPRSVAAVFAASLVLELVRSFSNLYFPNTWQLALGLFLLGTILFLPQGIGSLWARRRRPGVLDAAPGAAAPLRGAAE